MKKEIPEFKDIVKIVPKEIGTYLDDCSITQQSPEYHPEGNVYNHIEIVYNRARDSGDIDLAISALFHDLGKADTTEEGRSSGYWTAYGHEDVSAALVEIHRKWIREMGADPEKVYFIVKNHMRVKFMDQMNKKARAILSKHPLFFDLLKFSHLDNMKSLWESE